MFLNPLSLKDPVTSRVSLFPQVWCCSGDSSRAGVGMRKRQLWCLRASLPAAGTKCPILLNLGCCLESLGAPGLQRDRHPLHLSPSKHLCLWVWDSARGSPSSEISNLGVDTSSPQGVLTMSSFCQHLSHVHIPGTSCVGKSDYMLESLCLGLPSPSVLLLPLSPSLPPPPSPPLLPEMCCSNTNQSQKESPLLSKYLGQKHCQEWISVSGPSILLSFQNSIFYEAPTLWVTISFPWPPRGQLVDNFYLLLSKVHLL